MKKPIIFGILLFLVLSSAYCFNTTELSFTYNVDSKYSLIEKIATRELKENTESAVVNYKFSFLNLNGGLSFSKFQLEPSLGIDLVFAASCKKSSVQLSQGIKYNFKTEKFIRDFKFDYHYKRFLIGFSVNSNTVLNLSHKNWAEINNLEKNLNNASLGFYLGFTVRNKNLFDNPYKNVLINTFSSILHTGLGLEHSGDTFTSGFEFATTIPNVFFLHKGQEKYPYNATRAMAFTSYFFDIHVGMNVFELKKLSTNIGIELVSMNFDGKELQIPTKFQVYSLSAYLKETFWFTKKNGLYMKTGIPMVSVYLQNENNAEVRFITSDIENVLLAAKYMTKVGYVHKF